MASPAAGGLREASTPACLWFPGRLVLVVVVTELAVQVDELSLKAAEGLPHLVAVQLIDLTCSARLRTFSRSAATCWGADQVSPKGAMGLMSKGAHRLSS